jgi:hypothetical protein
LIDNFRNETQFDPPRLTVRHREADTLGSNKHIGDCNFLIAPRSGRSRKNPSWRGQAGSRRAGWPSVVTYLASQSFSTNSNRFFTVSMIFPSIFKKASESPVIKHVAVCDSAAHFIVVYIREEFGRLPVAFVLILPFRQNPEVPEVVDLRLFESLLS